MGIACTLLKLINHLKQPYKCIVNYACFSLQSSVIFLCCGFALIYYFIHEIDQQNPFYRGLALAGIVGVTIGMLLLLVGTIICVFYSRLFKVHQHHLQEIVEDDYCKKAFDKSSWEQENIRTEKEFATVKSSGSTTTALDAQQNIYPYNPDIPVVIPTAPPDPLGAIGDSVPQTASPWPVVPRVDETGSYPPVL